MKLKRLRVFMVIAIAASALATGAILYSQPAVAGPEITVYRSPG